MTSEDAKVPRGKTIQPATHVEADTLHSRLRDQQTAIPNESKSTVILYDQSFLAACVLQRTPTRINGGKKMFGSPKGPNPPGVFLSNLQLRWVSAQSTAVILKKRGEGHSGDSGQVLS